MVEQCSCLQRSRRSVGRPWITLFRIAALAASSSPRDISRCSESAELFRGFQPKHLRWEHRLRDVQTLGTRHCCLVCVNRLASPENGRARGKRVEPLPGIHNSSITWLLPFQRAVCIQQGPPVDAQRTKCVTDA